MTIYDIAKEAGVSASTVSRVVNNKSCINAETRKKVEALLKKYNYSPSETARGLVNKATKIIGILVSDIRTVHHTDGAYFIERELTKLGYSCIIFNAGGEGAIKSDLIKILSGRRVEGAILIGSSFQTDAVKSAIQKYLSTPPIIMINGFIDLPNVYGILADEKNGVANCVKLLLKKGHKNLAFIVDYHTPSNDLKIEGFQQGLFEMGIQKEALVYECESSIQGAYDATRKLVKEHPTVDGIIYSVDLLAAGGTRALLDIGKKVPNDVSVIGIDNSIYAEISNPKLTSLDNKILDLCVSGSGILLNVLEGKNSANKILVFSSIVERETT